MRNYVWDLLWLLSVVAFSLVLLVLSGCGGGAHTTKGSSNVSGSEGVISSAQSSSSSANSSTTSEAISSVGASVSSDYASSAQNATASQSSQTSATAARVSIATDASMYGLYVSLAHGRSEPILGSAEEEEALLKFVKNNGFNYLVFYNLEGLVSGSVKANQIASLISRARSLAGVTQVGAALGAAEEAEKIVAYNNSQPFEGRIDILNVESEFWNKLDRDSAFTNVVTMLEHFNQVAKANNLKTEIYVGWITEAEALVLGDLVDRILLHVYRQTDEGLINYGLERLTYLAGAHKKVVVAPIFSSEGPENTADIPFMGEWLITHPHQQAFATWLDGFNQLSDSWVNNLQVSGGVWYVYDKFLDIHPNVTSHILTSPQSSSLCIGDAAFLSVLSSATSKSICWMHNAQCLQDSAQIEGAATESLQIHDLSEADFGEYYALVTSWDRDNPTRFASASAVLSKADNCASR